MDHTALTGIAHLALYGPDGELLHQDTVHNLITDAGDLYYATRGAAAVSPGGVTDATKVTGMKLGTGTTAPDKNGAPAELGGYISGSNNAFDSGYPQLNNLGADNGVEIVYQTTWAAGDATNAAITEAVIVNDQSSDLTSDEADTISRITFTAVNKTASDTLVITWRHKFLGA